MFKCLLHHFSEAVIFAHYVIRKSSLITIVKQHPVHSHQTLLPFPLPLSLFPIFMVGRSGHTRLSCTKVNIYSQLMSWKFRVWLNFLNSISTRIEVIRARRACWPTSFAVTSSRERAWLARLRHCPSASFTHTSGQRVKCVHLRP